MMTAPVGLLFFVIWNRVSINREKKGDTSMTELFRCENLWVIYIAYNIIIQYGTFLTMRTVKFIL